MATGAAESWYHEKESAWLYGVVAAAEADPVKRALFVKLAAAAESQAACWLATRPPSEQQSNPVFAPAIRARIVALLVRRLGPRRLRPALAAMKLRGLSIYSGPNVPASHAIPTTVEEVGRRHSSVGGKLRAAVFGASDGLVSNASLVMGVAAAGSDLHSVQIAGAAGLLAGALSMSAGEYVSVRSQREFYEHQMALERAELAEYPEAEAEELALIYHARGVDMDEARRISAVLLSSPEQALDVLAREELGLNPNDLGSPFAAAGSSFVAFATGATVPLVPFFVGANGTKAVYWSAALTALALFAVGIALSLFTGRGAFRGGMRLLLIGGGAGIAAWTVGKLLGASLLQ
ncbi:MAG TPA: VIT1/CCC1 transporter family protein [Steroidobacteraceae bacterium]|nr:VIT1/CCC1 transporter family protein [Steroidobacteraceae bacterium]